MGLSNAQTILGSALHPLAAFRAFEVDQQHALLPRGGDHRSPIGPNYKAATVEQEVIVPPDLIGEKERVAQH